MSASLRRGGAFLGKWLIGRCRVVGVIKRELRRRSAIEPVIGHMKSDGHLGRNFLKGYPGDQANAVLSAVTVWVACRPLD